jgi:class 3 adenylate cyclase/tetratricopeptide (TPR) repeat protein
MAALERRCHPTLLFADLCDYTTLSETLDPEDMHELLQALEQLARRVVGKYRGSINQFVGDCILAMWGFPEPDEDGVRHAVDAALELHAGVRELGWRPTGVSLPRVELHSGIHSGLVFAREGDPLRGRYELTGDAVNTAARLCTAAENGDVLVSASALSGSESFFEVELVGALELKGRSRPVSAYRVLGRSKVETRLEARSKRGLTRFIGRECELSALESAALEATRRRGRALCVTGDAGIGKSRLFAELRARVSLTGVRVCGGVCESYRESGAPLLPFLQVSRELLGLTPGVDGAHGLVLAERGLAAIDEELLVHLPAFLQLHALRPLPGPPGAEQTQAAVIPALVSLLRAFVAKQPLVLLLDDWQWADGASTQVLGRLLRDLGDDALLVVVGARGVEADDPVLGPLERIELRPFSDQESGRMADELLPQAVARAQAAAIHRRSGGNPLFLEELCRVLVVGAAGNESEPNVVSTTVQGVIRARIERLPEPLAANLRVASVLGTEFPVWLFEGVTTTDGAGNALGELSRAGLLRPGDAPGSLRFQHGITREVVYESVRVRERLALHVQVARLLEERFQGVGLADQYEALALHYAAGQAHDEASRFAELAGDKAFASSALDRAREQYTSALEQLDRTTPATPELRRKWLAVVGKWAQTCVFDPSRNQLGVLQRAVAYAGELGDQRALGYAEYWLGWILYALGDQQAAVEHNRRALALAEQAQNASLQVQVLANLGQAYAAAGEYEAATEGLERAIEAKRLRSHESSRARSVPVGFAYALGCRALIHGDRGEFSAAHVQIQEAIDSVRDTGNPVEGSLLCLLGMIQIWQGRFEEALETAARGRATGERVNGRYVLAICRLVDGYARWVLEHSPAALEELEQAVHWLDQRQIRLYLSFGEGHLAQALFQAGAFARAAHHAARTLELAQRGDPMGAAMAYRTLAGLAVREGRCDDGHEQLALAFESAKVRGSSRETAVTELALGMFEHARDRREAARPLLERSLAAFEEMGMPWYRAEAARLLGC